ncbi:DUF6708 domain-containing protein [Undibacterium sp. Ren11W]|uniref:DUF6708 domain-containing protein n=1 Tax=Undibacterium sp. Ren11W TaxID=3413045 RepID=UPI003BEF96BE
MEYSGLLFKYPVNRPVSDEEKGYQLNKKKRLALAPVSQMTTIRMNSTFMEVVDKFYAYKGFMLMIVLPVFIGFLFFDFLMTYEFVAHDLATISGQKEVEGISAFIFMNILLLSICAWLGYMIKKEMFTYTHWPVRLNRKNRMVYVFRHNGPGGVLAVKWDDVFCCFAPGKAKYAGNYNWDIRCHVLDAKGLIKDTFTIGKFDTGLTDTLRAHWEFFRRYMEEGTQHLPAIEEYLPIATHREGFWFGLRRATANTYGNFFIWVITLPLTIPNGLARYLCMISSRIPRWPAEVEAACVVEPGSEIPAELENSTSIWKMAISLVLGLGVDAWCIWKISNASSWSGLLG